MSAQKFLPYGSKLAADGARRTHTHPERRFLCVLKIDLLITGVLESGKVGGGGRIVACLEWKKPRNIIEYPLHCVSGN